LHGLIYTSMWFDRPTKFSFYSCRK
jgi:hypothetical protein